ncbi:MAG: PQQ-binding-like beta-propeller repeat protein, partial [Elusimicrobia bacterium]|nr:PQQ-binding-like beta-propeller repeat protein [Elusimicrobiota bacterium]
MKNYKKFKIIILSVFLALINIKISNAFDWPEFMGTSDKTAYRIRHVEPPLTKIWSYNMFSPSICSPVVANGVVYVGNRAGSVYAFTSENGEVIWKTSVDGWVDASPLIYDGICYISTRKGKLYSLDAASGNVLRESNIGGKNLSSPLEYEGNIYLGRGTPLNDIIKLDLSGNILNSFSSGQPVWSSPMVYNGYIYCASNEGVVYKLDKNLNKVWEYETGTGIFRMSTISGYGGNVFFAPGDTLRRVYALDEDKNKIWETKVLNTGGKGLFTSSVSGDENNVYAVLSSTAGIVYSIDKNNGQTNWSVSLGKSSGKSYISGAVPTENTIYTGSENGYLYCISTGGMVTNKYLVETSSPSINSTPAVSNGKLFVITESGKIYAYESESVAEISSPPEYSVLKGTSNKIYGYAKDALLIKYELTYSTGIPSEDDIIISSSTSESDGGVIGNWDVSSLIKSTYTIKLLMNYSFSETGESSLSLLVDNPPPAPLSVTALDTVSDNGGSITLNWTLSAHDGNKDNDVTEYRIYKSTISGVYDYTNYVTLSSGTNNFNDTTGITDMTTYYYIVRAYSSNEGSGDSAEDSAYSINDLAPASPQGREAIPGDGFINIKWDTGSEPDLVKYNIYNSTENGNYELLTAVLHPPSTDQHMNLENNTTNYYYMTATDNVGNISASSVIFATYPYAGADTTSPARITDLVAVAGNKEGYIELYWTAPGDDGIAGSAEYYEIRYSTEEDAEGAKVLKDNRAVGGSSGYREEEIATGLNPKLEYYFYIKAYDNAANSGAFSAPSSTIPLGIPPSAIDDLTGFRSEDDERTVKIEWTAPGEDGTVGTIIDGKFNILYSTSAIENSGRNLVISTGQIMPGSKRQHIVTGLTLNATYYFTVNTVDSWSLVSNDSNKIYVELKNILPETITSLSARHIPGEKPGEGGYAVLNWTYPEEDVVSYEIYRSTITGVYLGSLETLAQGTTEYVDNNLSDGVKYYYSVRIYDGLGLSDYSNQVEVEAKSLWEKVTAKSGGKIMNEDGVEVILDKDTLSEDNYVSIKKLSYDTIPGGSYNADVNPLKDAWDFKLYKSVKKFNKPAIIKLPYSEN